MWPSISIRCCRYCSLSEESRSNCFLKHSALYVLDWRPFFLMKKQFKKLKYSRMKACIFKKWDDLVGHFFRFHWWCGWRNFKQIICQIHKASHKIKIIKRATLTGVLLFPGRCKKLHICMENHPVRHVQFLDNNSQYSSELEKYLHHKQGWLAYSMYSAWNHYQRPSLYD